jgi:hypothetical protein
MTSNIQSHKIQTITNATIKDGNDDKRKLPPGLFNPHMTWMISGKTGSGKSTALIQMLVPEILGDGTRDEYAVPAVPADALTAKPIVIRNSIGADTIGVKIDPVALFSGKLRVLLRDANHTPVSAGAGGGEINPATEAWSATFLFVHKS